MDITAVISELAESLAFLIKAAQKEYDLDDEDINLAIRWAMIERGVQNDE
ncbi:MAG: hypothetical protein DDT26_02649 [Dehalococcoidia bacterium]|nr:hypothetical protein [Chloroflexota bacterium]